MYKRYDDFTHGASYFVFHNKVFEEVSRFLKDEPQGLLILVSQRGEENPISANAWGEQL